MSILIFTRLIFFATIELTVMTATNKDNIKYTDNELLIPSYISEFLLEVFFLTHLFYMGDQSDQLGVKDLRV